MRMVSRAFWFAWLLWLSLASSSAFAESEQAGDSNAASAAGSAPAGYREAVEQALEDLQAGYFSEARGMFARAHELMPSAKTLWGLGMAEFELRSYVDSIGHLQQALDSQVRALAPEQRRQAESLLERASRYVTRLSLAIKPDTAHVELDGVLLESRELLLAAGDHSLEVSAPGFVQQRRGLHALGGDAQRLSILLSQLPTTKAAPAPPHLDRKHDDRARSVWKSPWLWSAVGVLMVGAAVTGGVLAARARRAGPDEPYGGTAGLSLPGL